MKIIDKIVIAGLFVLCLSGSTCKKEPPPEPLPIYNNPWGRKPSALSLVWRTALADDGQQAFSNNPVLNREGNILMSSLYNPNGREVFKLFDGKTGTLKWKWDDYLRDEENFMNKSHTVVNDAIILCAHNATYALNIITGQTMWKHFMEPGYGAGSPFVYQDNRGYVYHSFYGEDGSFSNYIFRTSYNQLDWELVCKFEDSTKSYGRIYSDNIAFSKNNNGDDLMFFGTWLSKGNIDTKAMMSCYNITKNRYEWQQDFKGKYAEFCSPTMVVIGDRVCAFTHYGDRYVVALNTHDGTIAWETKMIDDVIATHGVKLYNYNGSLIVLGANSSPALSLNANTGSIKWRCDFSYKNDMEADNVNFDFGNTDVFKNYLFSTQCDNLLILNLDNGKIVFHKQGAMDGGCLQYGVAINEQERTFYVQDRTYVNCFRLPDEVKY